MRRSEIKSSSRSAILPRNCRPIWKTGQWCPLRAQRHCRSSNVTHLCFKSAISLSFNPHVQFGAINCSAMILRLKNTARAQKEARTLLPLEPTSQIVRAGLTEQAAAEFIQRHGRAALTILADRTETAEELGHRTA